MFAAFALLAADQGDLTEAVEWYTLATRDPMIAHSRYFEQIAGQPITAMSADLPPYVVEAARMRGAARDFWQSAEELLEELSGRA